MVRHKLIQDSLGHQVCDCGYDPFFLLDPKPLDWTDQTRAVVAHIRQARRWHFRGVERRCGRKVYAWENELSGEWYVVHRELFKFWMSSRPVPDSDHLAAVLQIGRP